MRREELSELHNVVGISNISSIIEHGILFHRRAGRMGVKHESIANPNVQRVRQRKSVPGGLPLHEYACLYVNARNPMTHFWKEDHARLCILRIDPAVVAIPNVVVSDMNAARNAARFYPPVEGLGRLDVGVMFAQYWTHADPQERDRRKAMMCAEILVPHQIDPSYILGAYVSCEQSRRDVEAVAPGLPVDVNPYLFFQGPRRKI